MNPIGFLHFTDLHLGRAIQESRLSQLRDGLLSDLSTLHSEAGPWQLLLFSGDIVFSGEKWQFASADAFLDELYVGLERLGSRPLLVAVPGNHDLSRPQNQAVWVEMLRNWAKRPEFHDQFWKVPSEPPHTIVREAFGEFEAWYNKHRFPRPDLVNTHLGLLPGDFSTTLSFSDIKLGIVGLNTSYLQLAEGNYEARLALSLEQFHAACDGNGEAWCKKHDVCLLLTHHPTSWLDPDSRRIFSTEIAPHGRFALHLFGHLHEPHMAQEIVGGGYGRTVLQGNSLFAIEQAISDGSLERRHGYSAGQFQVYRDRIDLQIWPRTYQLDVNGFRFAMDNQRFFPEERTGATRPVKVASRTWEGEKLQSELTERLYSALDVIRSVGCKYAENKLVGTLTSFADAHYSVSSVDDIYKHDAEIIRDKLREGDAYRATCPLRSNPGAVGVQSGFWTRDAERFNDYIDAQCDAVAQGVDVQRIYIFKTAADALRPENRAHLQRLETAQITVKVIEESDLEDGLCSDFVLIGNDLVGIGYPASGAMDVSDYYINSQLRPRKEFTDYSNYFDRLMEKSIDFTALAHKNDSLARIELPRDPLAPACMEKTNVNIDGKPSKRLMLVLRTNGCFYDFGNNGCTMCDFKLHAIDPAVLRISRSHLMSQTKRAISEHEFGPGNVEQLDLLTLGSFFHDKEVDPTFRSEVMSMLASINGLKKVVIESRVGYFIKDPEKLIEVKRLLRDEQTLELGIGVESANEHIRNTVLKKDLKWQDLRKAAEVCAKTGVSFQPYLLIKPQTLSEREAIEDAVESAKRVAQLATDCGVRFRIAFEPVFVTQNTELEMMYVSGQYEVVNLWSVVEVLRRTHQLGTIFVGLSDENLSRGRKPRSCSRCNQLLLDALETFNAYQDVTPFDSISCTCFADQLTESTDRARAKA